MTTLREMLRRCVLLIVTSLPLASCATITGTLVSPVTGGVDLCRESGTRWYLTPFVFVGGAVAGPFVAFYNGCNYDPTVFKSFEGYWRNFAAIFRPFHLIAR